MDRLPADLEIGWSAHLKTTAGTTHFRREVSAVPDAAPRYLPTHLQERWHGLNMHEDSRRPCSTPKACNGKACACTPLATVLLLIV